MWQRIKLVLSNKTVMLRIAITLLIILVFKIASYIPIPLFNKEQLTTDFGSGFLSILNSYSGQALARFSVFSLGISPYITASIAVQLLQTVIPSLKEWNEQGEAGKQKSARLTRYLAIALAFAQALLLILGVGSPLQHGVRQSIWIYLYMALTVTAASAVTIWLADLITAKGVGNGTSIMIVTGMVTSLPIMYTTLSQKYLGSSFTWGNLGLFSIIVLLNIFILLAVIYVYVATRKIPIQYANRQGKTDSNIPLKINSAGVLPVIFASTLTSIPLTIVGLTSNSTSGTSTWINNIFNSQEPLGFILYMILIVIFSFFYTFMTVNPTQMADNLSKQDAYIPGIRPGEDTKNFIAKILFKITVIGTVFIAVLAALPIITSWIFGFTAAEASAISIGGTSLLIIVGVAVETTQQIEAAANKDQYTGLF
ncbi:Preprotein translocase subunit SecY [Alteracholeplasma palmae J233]|uniref:Protein translocase subunit SecY n=1 Tax=Alteracholeplasma palmae (strain ATCC 49389 / J233) TaxID=1318466 RepID=U4KLU9_ALTPJ|nr:preprotein translocase subunit SecY [Alteracholeplasma palmae]CCV64907.1 Preprotein translocase subunit SecY [Alteracholeplasma palmae J233]